MKSGRCAQILLVLALCFAGCVYSRSVPALVRAQWDGVEAVVMHDVFLLKRGREYRLGAPRESNSAAVRPLPTIEEFEDRKDKTVWIQGHGRVLEIVRAGTKLFDIHATRTFHVETGEYYELFGCVSGKFDVVTLHLDYASKAEGLKFPEYIQSTERSGRQ